MNAVVASEFVKTQESVQAAQDLFRRLSCVWARILQTTEIDPQSDFFELGGDSLIAVALLVEIEREFGIKLPVTVIYDAPTVAQQAVLIQGEPLAGFSPLVLLKAGDDTAPLFIVHGFGGTVFELAALGRQIRWRGPVYAVQARGIDGTQAPLDSVEHMASAYLSAVRELQPRGPYFLAGYSFGGLVAFEMARLAATTGDKIGLLLLIDSYPHPVCWPVRPKLALSARRNSNRLMRAVLRPGRAVARLRAGWPKTASQTAHEGRSWPFPADPSLPQALRGVHKASATALMRYAPARYSGNVVFLRANITDPVYPRKPAQIWKALASRFEVHSLPGTHVSMMREHADAIATCVSECLERAGEPADVR